MINKMDLYKSRYWLVVLDREIYLIDKIKIETVTEEEKKNNEDSDGYDFYVDTPEGIRYFRKEQIRSTGINYFDFLMNDKNVAPFYKYGNGDELFKFDREELISLGGIAISFAMNELTLFYSYLEGTAYYPIKRIT